MCAYEGNCSGKEMTWSWLDEIMSKFKFMFAFLYKYNNSSVIFSIVIITIIITICSYENKQPVYICTNEVNKSIPLHSEAR